MNIVYVRIMKLVKLIMGVEEKEICVLILPGPPRAMTNGLESSTLKAKYVQNHRKKSTLSLLLMN